MLYRPGGQWATTDELKKLGINHRWVSPLLIKILTNNVHYKIRPKIRFISNAMQAKKRISKDYFPLWSCLSFGFKLNVRYLTIILCRQGNQRKLLLTSEDIDHWVSTVKKTLWQRRFLPPFLAIICWGTMNWKYSSGDDRLLKIFSHFARSRKTIKSLHAVAW